MVSNGIKVSRRLSKPRTNNNSSSNLLISPDQTLEANSPFGSSDMDYFGDATVVTSQGERRSRRKSRTKLRAYLYGSTDSSQTLSSSDEQESPPNRRSRALSAGRKRVSRTNSAFQQLSSAKASAIHLTSSSKVTLPIASDPDESAVVAKRIKERALADSLAASNHVTSPVDEEKHVDSVFAPVRRKSLYTPGLATRNVSDILRKPPSPDAQVTTLTEAERNYYYNPCHPETSPLARLAALDIHNDGRSTPASLDVSHLGGLQLGTLRVMNGTSSPPPQHQTPFVCTTSPVANSNGRNDHLTVSQGSDDEGKLTSRDSPKSCSSTLKSSSISRGTNAINHVETCPDMPGCAPTMADAYMAVLNGGPFTQTESGTTARFGRDLSDDEAVALANSYDEAQSANATADSQVKAFERLNGRSNHNMESERRSIPCSFSSEYSATKDDGLKPDSGYNSNESFQACEIPDILYERNCVMNHQSENGVWQRSRGLAELQTTRPNLPLMIRPISPIVVQHPEKPEGKSKLSVDSSNTSRPSWLSNRLSSQNTVRKLHKPRPHSQPPSVSTSINPDMDKLSETDIPRVPSLMAAKHAERLRRFPLLEHTYPSSQHVSLRDSATTEFAEAVPIRFPSPTHKYEDDITGPSMDAVLYQTGQITTISDKFPLMVHGAIDDDDLGTTSAVVRSPTWSAFGPRKKKREQTRLVKRAELERREEAKRLKKQQEKLTREERKEKSSRSRTSSRTRCVSNERRLSYHETVATIADFGTVANSLGGSPYDIATLIHPNAGREANGCHPHQMSHTLQRPKSYIDTKTMSARVPDDYSPTHRTRRQSFTRFASSSPGAFVDAESESIEAFDSQDSTSDVPPVPALSITDIRTRGLEWTRKSMRSHSYTAEDSDRAERGTLYSGTFYDRGGIPGRMPRPCDLQQDAPPLPASPMPQQGQRRSANAVNKRPQSMFIDASPAVAKFAEPETGAPQLGEKPEMLASRTPPIARSSQSALPGPWTNGSLEKKNLKQDGVHARKSVSEDPVQSVDPDSAWEVQRRAWSERRRSAGEALMNRNRLHETIGPVSEVETTPSPGFISEAQSNEQSGGGGLVQPMADQHIPRTRIGSEPSYREATSSASRLTGRYEGGLYYGFEPGCGLGGSAGTRSAQTEASRKSLNMSRGFGLDLSDLPIFVAAAPR